MFWLLNFRRISCPTYLIYHTKFIIQPIRAYRLSPGRAPNMGWGREGFMQNPQFGSGCEESPKSVLVFLEPFQSNVDIYTEFNKRSYINMRLIYIPADTYITFCCASDLGGNHFFFLIFINIKKRIVSGKTIKNIHYRYHLRICTFFPSFLKIWIITKFFLGKNQQKMFSMEILTKKTLYKCPSRTRLLAKKSGKDGGAYIEFFLYQIIENCSFLIKNVFNIEAGRLISFLMENININPY